MEKLNLQGRALLAPAFLYFTGLLLRHKHHADHAGTCLLYTSKLMSECNVTLDTASADQIYRCLAMITRQIMSDRQKQFQSKVLGEGKKQVYYLCMEMCIRDRYTTALWPSSSQAVSLMPPSSTPPLTS